LAAFYCYIPSAFTPNRDYLNECFGPKGQAIESYTLEIFSRYGNTVYKGNSCWDGNFKGLTLSDGMFIYHLSVRDVYGGTHYYTGHFYLLK
jgi:gliding motility-associated-like protein